ncbi:alpha/beta hydrolase [Limosilactobacillus sp.]|uniref:alpha/beta hydrolase n=1 Tax=Limosilactobacillus sp. TaxID=2773925 RepID=UPI00345E514A
MIFRRYFWLSLVVILCTLVWTQPVHAAKYVQSTTPTIFFHGYNSGAHAEQFMVNGIKKAGVSKASITAEVDADGKVTLLGTIPRQAANPLVMVNFENSRNTDYTMQGQWVKNVIVKLQDRYHFKRINIEAHSMGNLAVMYYLLHDGRDHRLPQIQKQAALAGTFDGAMGWNEPANLTINPKTGKPSRENASFKKLLPLRHTYPQQIKVLNLYGDLGNGNDSQVSNNSSRTLRYLINDRAASYKEVKITGPNASHELLHRNPQVNRELIKFFWEK